MTTKITQTTQEIALKVYNYAAVYSNLTEAEKITKLAQINAWLVSQNIFANGRNLSAMDLRHAAMGWREVEHYAKG